MVKDKINEFMTALKSGDIDTLKSLTKLEFYDNLSYPDEYKKIIAAFYGNMIWTLDYIPSYEFEDINDTDSFDITIDVGSRRFLYYKDYDVLRYNKGDVIPDGFKYESDEKAWEAFNATLEKMPLLYQRWIFRITPDGNGGMTIATQMSDYSTFLDDEYELSHVENPGETLIDLLEEEGASYCVVAPDGVEIEYNDENGGGVGVRQKAVNLMKQKKYREAYELILSKSDDISSSLKEDYDGLTDSQKKYVQETLDKCNVYPVETQIGTSKKLDVTLLLDCPILYTDVDEEELKWINENNLRDIDVEYCTLHLELDMFYDRCFSFYSRLVYDAGMRE